MTQEEQKILLQDLCARLPYDVKVWVKTHHGQIIESDILTLCNGGGYYSTLTYEGILNDSVVKPYLRPLSAITEEEKNELKKNGIKLDVFSDSKYIAYQWCGSIWEQDPLENEDMIFLYHWFHNHLFDINGLIPKGLAIEAPIDMYDSQKK